MFLAHFQKIILDLCTIIRAYWEASGKNNRGCHLGLTESSVRRQILIVFHSLSDKN